jgi:ankyrin repeat protein
MQGNTTLLSQVLSQHPDCVDGPTTGGAQAPLLVAALLGQQGVVEMLLSAGGNPNRRGKRQETALMLAAQRGHVDVMRVLLSRGAQATAVDQRGWTALHFGAFAGHAASIRAMVAATAPSARPAMLELKTGKGETALALAAFGRKDECCRALIEAGAKPALIADAGDREYVVKLQQSAQDGGGDKPDGAALSPKGLSTISPKAARGAAPSPAAQNRSGAQRRGPPGRAPLVTDGLSGGQAADSPGPSPSARPALQFSGTPSEFERCGRADGYSEGVWRLIHKPSLSVIPSSLGGRAVLPLSALRAGATRLRCGVLCC